MIRLLFTIIAGVLLGGIVHLVSVLALPRIATQDAYSRLTPMTKLNAVTPLPLADPNNAPMPFMDPAFAIAICRYDLSGGSIKLSVPVSQAYTSVSFYTRNEVAYYAINDRSAGRKVIELDLMTEAQHAELPEDEDVTAADRLIINSPTATGLIVLKALAAEPGLMPQAQASLAASSCKVQTEPPPKQAEPPPPPRTSADRYPISRKSSRARSALHLTARPITGCAATGGLAVCAASSPIRRSASAAMIVRRLEHQPFQRPAVRRNPPLQALLHPLHDQAVLLHAGDRVGALARRQFRNVREAGVALPVEIDHPHGDGKERLEAGDVVAHVVHQLRIARGVRAVRLVDQQAPIGGAIEHRRLPPWRRQRLVIAEHALPGRARMRRLDQGIGEIAEQPFVVGELELRRLQADARCHLGADPAMHVVVEEILAGAAEIAAAAAAERARRREAASARAQKYRTCGLVRIGMHVSGISKGPDVSVDGDGGPGPYLLPVRCHRWFHRFRARSGRQEGSGRFPCLRVERHPWLSPAAAKPHPPEIQ